MIARTKVGLLGGLALSAGIAATFVLAGGGDAAAPVRVDPLKEAAQAAIPATPTPEHAVHSGSDDCCRSGHGDGKGAHAQCPMKAPAPVPEVQRKAAAKCPYLAQMGQAGPSAATEKPGK